jgi:hypothetical protein
VGSGKAGGQAPPPKAEKTCVILLIITAQAEQGNLHGKVLCQGVLCCALSGDAAEAVECYNLCIALDPLQLP